VVSQIYNVGIVVGGSVAGGLGTTTPNGNYTDSTFANNTVDVTVSQLQTGMITGGGFTINNPTTGATYSAGTYAGDPGQRTNFGFNAKINKNSNYQGNVNVIVRRAGHVYQIKSNSISNIGETIPTQGCTSSTPCTGTFVGGANIQDVTNPSSPISIQGNLTLTVTLHDYGEPGSSDTIAITVKDSSNALYFSNNWTATAGPSVEQTENGGNLVVH
jgi:hypothetical protein